MQVIVDELLINYQLSGKGKLVLLLHGWGDAASGVADLQRYLSKKYQVIALDLPGFGASSPPLGVWNLDDYGKFLKTFLAKLELDEPYAVVGHSNGGALAIRAISLGKLQPQKLVLLAASGIRNSANTKKLLLKVIAKTGNIATIWMPMRYRRALRRGLYGAAGSDMLVAPKLEETFKKTVRQDVQADAARLNLPTLLVYAETDQAVPVADGQTYHRLIKDSELIIIPGAGHFLHIEQFDAVVKPMEKFLK